MSMTQLVIGTALGFFVAQGVLYSIKHLIGWVQRSDARKRILKLPPALGSTFIGGFTKYATLIGASAAVNHVGCVGCRRLFGGRNLHAARRRPTSSNPQRPCPYRRAPLTGRGLRDMLRRPSSIALQRFRLTTSTRTPTRTLKVQRRSHHAGTALSSQGDSPAAVRRKSSRGPAQGDSTAPVPVAVRLRGCRPRQQVP